MTVIPRRLPPWGAAAFTALVLSPLAPFLAGFLPRCPTKVLTSYPCPLCGTTRAALALAQLDLAAAFAVNPLIALAWVVFVVGGLVAAVRAVFGRPPIPVPWGSIPAPLWWLLGLVTLANWVYLIYHGT